LSCKGEWPDPAGETEQFSPTGPSRVEWKPIYNILESRFTMLLVNGQWIAQLLQYGLLTGSFIPPRSQRELRRNA
jgi:hypothetical protein